MVNSTDPTMIPSQERARRRLMQEVGSRWVAGSRLPPIRQLAGMLGTGQTNTFRAVRQLIAEGVLVAKPHRGTFVQSDFMPPEAAGGVEESSSGVLRGKLIQIVHPGGDDFSSPALSLMERELSAAGARPRTDAVKMCHYDRPRFLALLAAADGLVLFNPLHSFPGRAAPLVALLISTAEDQPLFREAGYDVVTVEDHHGGFLVGRHLLAAGARRVCFVGCGAGRSYDRISTERLRGFERGFEGRVAASDRIMVPEYMPKFGGEALAKVTAHGVRPDAVFCASDDLAVGFAAAARARDLRPGWDFQLVGFDGQLRGRQLPGGPLTTVDVPLMEMARVGLDILRQRFVQPWRPVRRVHVGCSLYQGTTTHAPVEHAV